MPACFPEITLKSLAGRLTLCLPRPKGLGPADIFNFTSSALGALNPLRDDAFKVAFTSSAVRVAQALDNVIEVQQAGFDARHDLPQPSLAFEKG
jgi:hypothetical protein